MLPQQRCFVENNCDNLKRKLNSGNNSHLANNHNNNINNNNIEERESSWADQPRLPSSVKWSVDAEDKEKDKTTFHRQNTPFLKELKMRHKMHPAIGDQNKKPKILESESESESDNQDGMNNNAGRKFNEKMSARQQVLLIGRQSQKSRKRPDRGSHLQMCLMRRKRRRSKLITSQSESEVKMVKLEHEKLGISIKGGLDKHDGNPNNDEDDGIFISKINPAGVVAKDRRLRVGQRILEVNEESLLGVTHEDAVGFLRGIEGGFTLLVCEGYDHRAAPRHHSVTNINQLSIDKDTSLSKVGNKVKVPDLPCPSKNLKSSRSVEVLSDTQVKKSKEPRENATVKKKSLKSVPRSPKLEFVKLNQRSIEPNNELVNEDSTFKKSTRKIKTKFLEMEE